MSSITSFLENDHAQCDALFNQAEACVEQGDWSQAAVALRAFNAALERHFAMEEEVLFRIFEEATGSHAGPTAVMRTEHRQLRLIIASAEAAVAVRDATDFFAAAETMQIMMGQHNLKEESVLYPMADQALAARREHVVEEMRECGERARVRAAAVTQVPTSAAATAVLT